MFSCRAKFHDKGLTEIVNLFDLPVAGGINVDPDVAKDDAVIDEADQVNGSAAGIVFKPALQDIEKLEAADGEGFDGETFMEADHVFALQVLGADGEALDGAVQCLLIVNDLFNFL